MPIIVSNSSPIINLAIIGRLDLLKKFWGEVFVPEAVWQEVTVEGVGRSEIENIKNADWIIVEKVVDQSLVLVLNQDLDKGESEAIVLSIEKNADIILLDESDAREAAGLFKINKTGVLGILIRAKLENQISCLKEEINKLQEEANFWLKESLVQRVLKEVGEN